MTNKSKVCVNHLKHCCVPYLTKLLFYFICVFYYYYYYLFKQEQKGFTLKKGMYVDGSIYCQIVHDPVVTVQENVFDLTKTEYHILLAAGSRLKSMFFYSILQQYVV